MQVEGTCDPAFEAVRELFTERIASGEDRGNVCLRVEGKTVLNLWGGTANPQTGEVWTEKTLACCFSVTKGVFALLMHVLASRGQIDLDANVTSLWPAFGQRGKTHMTVSDVLCHRAGLPAVNADVPEGSLYDTAAMERLLEASAPVLDPGSSPVYHNMTYGYLVGGLCARAAGRPVKDLIRSCICEPLAADFHIGLSAADQARCAQLSQDDPDALFRALDETPDTLFARSMAFFARDEDFNSQKWRGAVIGSGNGHATAEALAKIYEQFNPNGTLLTVQQRAAIRRLTGHSAGPDPILGIPIKYGQGVELSMPPHLDFGPSSSSVGYWGAGGAQAFADTDAGLAFAYVTGHMDAAMGSSKRARDLVTAAYSCL